MRVFGGTVIGAVALWLPASSVGQPSSFVIQGDYKIGGYPVKQDGTLFGAIQEFGEPTRTRRQRIVCLVSWRSLGLTIAFYNLGGRNPCAPQYGYFSSATMTGRQWRTSSALRIGVPQRYIFRYFARAKPSPRTSQWWWLVARRTIYGAGGVYGGLEAKVVNGWVSAFRVNYQAGGE
jgi:hypothetical protein